jgi:hypothetical protein
MTSSPMVLITRPWAASVRSRMMRTHSSIAALATWSPRSFVELCAAADIGKQNGCVGLLLGHLSASAPLDP